MKFLLSGFVQASILVLIAVQAQAQYKGPRDYFPKNNTVPGVTNPSAPKTPANPAPGAPAAPPAPGTATQQPRFKELPVNSQFYFLSDTNHAYSWTKISATTAKNTKNGVVQPINGETPIQR